MKILICFDRQLKVVTLLQVDIYSELTLMPVALIAFLFLLYNIAIPVDCSAELGISTGVDTYAENDDQYLPQLYMVLLFIFRLISNKRQVEILIVALSGNFK